MKRLYITHRRINNILTGIAVLFGFYLMVAPFLPQITWWLHPPKPIPIQPITVSHATAKPAPIPSDNLLIVPRLAMKEVIHDGPTMAELRKGVWLIPHTSQPDLKSNTVIIGHRFTYAGPAVFYFLDKIQVGDPIIIDWHSKEYTYKVTQVNVVPPTQVSVIDPSPNPELTLYTCTPLWTAKNRLIIVAPLQGVRS